MTTNQPVPDGPDVDPQATQGQQRRISRRAVLKAAGIGGGAFVIAGAAVGIRGGMNGVWNQGQGEPYELWHSRQDTCGLVQLVAAGTLAANPHNIQPWSFVVDRDSIDLYAVPGRIMPVNDSDGRERIAGYGCAIHNIVLAARRRDATPRSRPGRTGDPHHRADRDRGGRACHRAGQALAQAISTRHSNRGPYAGRAVVQDVLDSLVDDAPDGAELVWITEPAALSDLLTCTWRPPRRSWTTCGCRSRRSPRSRNDRADVDRHRERADPGPPRASTDSPCSWRSFCLPNPAGAATSSGSKPHAPPTRPPPGYGSSASKTPTIPGRGWQAGGCFDTRIWRRPRPASDCST